MTPLLLGPRGRIRAAHFWRRRLPDPCLAGRQHVFHPPVHHFARVARPHLRHAALGIAPVFGELRDIFFAVVVVVVIVVVILCWCRGVRPWRPQPVCFCCGGQPLSFDAGGCWRRLVDLAGGGHQQGALDGRNVRLVHGRGIRVHDHAFEPGPVGLRQPDRGGRGPGPGADDHDAVHVVKVHAPHPVQDRAPQPRLGVVAVGPPDGRLAGAGHLDDDGGPAPREGVLAPPRLPRAVGAQDQHDGALPAREEGVDGHAHVRGDVRPAGAARRRRWAFGAEGRRPEAHVEVAVRVGVRREVVDVRHPHLLEGRDAVEVQETHCAVVEGLLEGVGGFLLCQDVVVDVVIVVVGACCGVVGKASDS